MVVISVEVPDVMVTKIDIRNTISIERLYEIDNNNWNTVVDFWKEWLWKEEFLEYLSTQKK